MKAESAVSSRGRPKGWVGWKAIEHASLWLGRALEHPFGHQQWVLQQVAVGGRDSGPGQNRPPGAHRGRGH